MATRSGRPEHIGPPELFYNDEEAKKYSQNSRIIEIQMQMSERALELLSLPPDQPSFILDIGCGSGLSGEAITESGHYWVGLDISQPMLDVALKREVEGDLFVHDMGQGLGFRPGSFDGAIRLALWMWLLSCQFCHTFCKSPSNFLSSIIWYTHFSDVVSHSIHVNVSHGCSVHTHNGSFHYKPPLLVTFPLL
jgi:18S rRNA (guanine1575-N7)-methyltransferase